MANYHVKRCEEIIQNAGASPELRILAESLVAIASGVDDADSMVQQALERIDICLERIQDIDKRLCALEGRQ